MSVATASLGAGNDILRLDSSFLASAVVDFGSGADTCVSTVPIAFPRTTRNL